MKVKLNDDEWQRILPVLKPCTEIRLGAGRDVRRFFEAVLWMTRSGAQWRLLPKPYGNWNWFTNALTGGVNSASLKNCSSILAPTATLNIS